MKKVLLIEDNKDVRENTAEILELANYQVITATNGKEGVKLAQKEFPNIIICDIMMPELDGYGVLHMLSKNNETARIPFIFLTAKTEIADLRKGMNLGADDYLTKPFDDNDLLNAIETRLKKTDLLQQQFSNNAEGLNHFLNEAKGLDSLNHLSETRPPKTYKKKELIYNEGAYPKGVYMLEAGKVKTYKTNENGKEYITGLFKAGDFFGYTAILEDEEYHENAEALETSEVVLLPRDDFFTLMTHTSDVAQKFIKLLSLNLNDREDQLLKLAYNSVRKRVAEALVKLDKRYKNEKQDNFTIAISREDIARMVGTATETVIRTLSDFKEEKIIQVKGSSITILDLEKLKKMKN